MNKIFSVLIIVLSFLILNGCGEKKSSVMVDLNGGKKGGGTFRINELENVRSLDPVGINDNVSHHVAHQIYDLLIDLDSSLQLEPALAKSWEISDDGLLYTFHLRSGVKFQDNACFPDGKGREFKASDVKYSFDRVCDPTTGTLGFDFYKNYVVGASEFFDEMTLARRESRDSKLKDVSGYIVKDDTTFQIQLKKPFGPFIYYMCLGFAYIVPREAVEKYGKDFFQNPVGTGPYIFVNWSPDLELNLKKNPNYWEKDEFGNQLPYVDEIKFRFLKDLSQQMLEFQNGNLDECYRIPNESFKAIVTPEKTLTPEYSQFILQKNPSLSLQFYGFLTTGKIFNNEKVRQAFNYAIDREKILKFVLNGQGFMGAIYGIVPPPMPNYDVKRIKGYTYDLNKAKQLMAEAGYPDGKGFPDAVLQINSGGDRNIQLAESIQNMLKEIGVNMKMNIMQFAQHLDNIDAGRADLFRLGWIADYPDPENFLNLYYGKNVPKDPKAISPINSTRFQNAEFDALFEKAIATTDQKARYELYYQAEQIATDKAPTLLIFYEEDYRLIQPYVKGFPLDPMHRINFRRLWLDK
ncbi:MAG: ABC transporter substrate-binding protein [Ignavibacteriae bacterium]|nr:ABC transporter substrate-binding protein [Ignavibacteriota bacterium]